MTISTLAAAISSTPALKLALDDGVRRVRYGELSWLVAEEAKWLASCPGTRFALLADNGVGWAIADLALHLGRHLSVPLPGYFTSAQLAHALDDAGIDAVLTDEPARMDELPEGWRAEAVSDRSGLSLFSRQLAPEARPAVPAGTAKVTYTSGSTATPKGVCLSAAQLETLAASLAGATASLAIQRHLCLLPLPTLLENIAGLYAPLSVGATCLLPSTATTGMRYSGPDPALLLRAVAERRPESLILVPELLRLLVAASEGGWRPPGSLKFIAVGGASVPLSLLERAAAVGLPVYEGYGLSECASVVCLNTPGARRAGSVGRPLPHARLRVADDGELMVSGVTLLGYLGGEPREPDAEWATGDLGERDADGYFHVRGRLRNMFVTSLGRNVAPEWVEGEIAQQRGIRHAMVLGEARPYAVALVSASPAEADAAAIERAIEAANARLPDYAQVRRWARAPEPFSLANGLLTANGRLRRREIANRYGSLLDALYRDELAS